MVPVLLSVLIAYGVNGCLTVSIYDVMLLIKELPYVPQLKPLHAYKLQAKHIVAAPSGVSITGDRDEEGMKRRKTGRRRRRKAKKGSSPSMMSTPSSFSSSSSPREQFASPQGAPRRERGGGRRERGERRNEEEEVFASCLDCKRSGEREDEEEERDGMIIVQKRGASVLSFYEREEEEEGSSPSLYRKELLHRTALSLRRTPGFDVCVIRDRAKERKILSWECRASFSSPSVSEDTQEAHKRMESEREFAESFRPPCSSHDALADLRMKGNRHLAFCSSSSSEKEMNEVFFIEQRFRENSHVERGDQEMARKEKKASSENTRVSGEREEERDGWVRDEEDLERERRREEERDEREKDREAKEEEEERVRKMTRNRKTKARNGGNWEDEETKKEEKNHVEEEREEQEEDEEEATDDMEVSYPLEFSIVLDKHQGTVLVSMRTLSIYLSICH